MLAVTIMCKYIYKHTEWSMLNHVDSSKLTSMVQMVWLQSVTMVKEANFVQCISGQEKFQ